VTSFLLCCLSHGRVRLPAGVSCKPVAMSEAQADTLEFEQHVAWAQADACMPATQAGLLAALRRWTVAYSRALLTHLREDGDVTAELQVKLASDASDVAKLASAEQMHAAACCAIPSDCLSRVPHSGAQTMSSRTATAPP